MTRLITALEVHRYAPELNKLHLRNRQTLPVPGITTIKEAKARLFGRWQPGHLAAGINVIGRRDCLRIIKRSDGQSQVFGILDATLAESRTTFCAKCCDLTPFILFHSPCPIKATMWQLKQTEALRLCQPKTAEQ
ncbi:hypothetical protein [Aeromonas sobria]|uniref:hypothetical protein n=1 Tax=Aeromonas sobria TaxID=646 RepID=UPI0012FF420D|nr:hypothetical protein [Aeromonas sobria]